MRIRSTLWVLGLLCVSLAAPASAQVPTLINYQGRLLDGTNLYNGTVNMRLLLYTVSSGGAQVYEDTGTVAVVDGLYSTYIGDGTALGSLSAALTNSAVYLEVIVNSTILSPRERIAAVAYAIMASSVSTGAITSAMIANDAVTGNKIADGTISNSDIAATAAIADTKLGTIATAGKVANSALSASVSLLGQTIETAEITDGTVAAADVNSATFSQTFWRVGGNAGTTPASHLIGTTDGAALRISAGGGVGIGTDTPDDALDVEGASPRVRISNTAETEGGLSLVDQQDPSNQFARLLYDASGTTNQNLNIYVNSTNPILTVKGNQRIGIGTTTPTDAILDIEGDTHINEFDVFLRGGSDRSHGLGWYGSGKPFAGENVDGPVVFGFGGGVLGRVNTGGSVSNAVLRWTSAGRVGIGTNSPNNILDVYGSGTTNGGVGASAEVVARVRRTPGAHSALSVDAPPGQDSVLYLAEDGAAQWGLRQDSDDAHKFNLRFHGGAVNKTLVTVQSNGFVGIGTTAPATNLDVRGDIKLGTTGQYFAAGGDENLRIVRGSIFYDGSTLHGYGFSSTNSATGIYRIVFDTPFSDDPSVVAISWPTAFFEPRIVGLILKLPSEVRLGVWTYSGTLTNFSFDFIAAGPR